MCLYWYVLYCNTALLSVRSGLESHWVGLCSGHDTYFPVTASPGEDWPHWQQYCSGRGKAKCHKRTDWDWSYHISCLRTHDTLARSNLYEIVPTCPFRAEWNAFVQIRSMNALQQYSHRTFAFFRILHRLSVPLGISWFEPSLKKRVPCVCTCIYSCLCLHPELYVQDLGTFLDALFLKGWQIFDEVINLIWTLDWRTRFLISPRYCDCRIESIGGPVVDARACGCNRNLPHFILCVKCPLRPYKVTFLALRLDLSFAVFHVACRAYFQNKK